MESVSIFQKWISPDVDKSSLPSLRDPKVRDGVYKLIPSSPQIEHRMLIQELLCEEVIYRRQLWEHQRSDDDCFENLYLCAFLLCRLKIVGDVYHLWEVKHINMDVGSIIDAFYFVGSGVDQTLHFLEKEGCDKSKQILQYIKDSQVTDEDYEEWSLEQVDYHEISLA